ncbi:tumor necrosis factor ligand superfamily member 13 isoform X1 [Esox lucius]|uniref:tumor necrosis factor ligand superfamily member 13 isoform X1 n=1 Tax=Esox lucius TaxID=8010 RepID=UPI0014772B8E|nr:tumor necrosis factor ligand superfamily member 13 isoform X1 [Esox lucius]XP_034148989.1 tumor necrosis factor ligand superfamily member 13 isoform X1 [Esox lucius]
MTNSYPVNFHGSYLLYAVLLLLACLVVLQSNRVREMQMELRELRQWTLLVCGNREESSPDDVSRCGIFDPDRRTKWNGVRVKRDVKKRGSRQQRCTAEGGEFLHLVPLSSLSDDENDFTVVKWAPGQSLGAGLRVSGETVTVETAGTYFIYSQVLYKDTTWTMGHVIQKNLHGIESSLMKCIQSMPSNITVAQNTCYTAGVHYLEQDSTLKLCIPRKSAGLVLRPHTTFLGMFRI